MLRRRDVMGGGLLTGLIALMLPKPAAAAEQSRAGTSDDRAIAEAIDRLRAEFVKSQDCTPGPCGAISTIRTQQNTFIRANQKFPDYIDAGVDAWDAVHDWHVKNQQPIRMTRLPDGRYGITFMFTVVVLRYENTPNYISFGYDAR